MPKHFGLKLLEEFKAPPYVTLTHTWGPVEVCFQELHKPIAESNLGYQKIKNCCEQALEVGIQHVWVDTCCGI